mmetsp:Transcript_883/g.934  ORF Transcript_883/g.934 Transcript_883/m.934 type:complete len:101 (-) Transcript_883:306-608(-)
MKSVLNFLLLFTLSIAVLIFLGYSIYNKINHRPNRIFAKLCPCLRKSASVRHYEDNLGEQSILDYKNETCRIEKPAVALVTMATAAKMPGLLANSSKYQV